MLYIWEQGKWLFFLKCVEAFPEEDCVEVKGALIAKTASILHGFVLTFPLSNQVKFQHLSVYFSQLLSWATASLKTHQSNALYFGGLLGSRGIE